MSDKIQAALEARKSRKKKEEESFAEKQKKSQAKIDSALKARETRITNNLQSTLSDLGTRINAEIEAYKKISIPSWGGGNDALKNSLESTRQNRINVDNLIRETEAYRKHLGDKKTDTLLSSLNSMKDAYESYVGVAEIRSQFESEDEYKIAYKDAKKLSELYSMTSAEIQPYLDAIAKTEEEKKAQISALNSERSAIKSKLQQHNRGNKQYNTPEKKKAAEDRVKAIDQHITFLEESESGIAYTTSSGQNITWQKLYDDKKAEEDVNALYDELSANDDWEEKSQYITTNLKGTYRSSSIIDPSVDWEYEDVNKYQPYFSGGGFAPDWEYATFTTDKEKAVFNYLYHTQGKDAAFDWHNSRKGIYKDRQEAKAIKFAIKFAEDYPIFSDAVAMAGSVFSGGEYIADLITGNAGDTNQIAAVSSAIKGTRMEQIDWEIGNWDAFDFLYSTTTSGLESAASSLVFGKLGGVALGLSAAAQGTNDALNRGMDNKQAFWNGFFNGVFEGFFETVSIGQFKALKEGATTGFKNFAKNIGKSMLVNASEETLTEIANIAYDTLVNGEFANYTLEDLKNGAWKNALGQVVEAGASGALMGIGFGSIGSAISYKRTASNAGDMYGDIESQKTLISKGLASVDGSLAHTLAKKYQVKLDAGKSLSGGEISRLIEANEQAFVAEDITKMTTATEARLTELGETGDVPTIAKAIVKKASGKKLTSSENSALESSKYGQRVVNEISPEGIASGEYTSAWAENIGTERINTESYNRDLVEHVRKIAEEQLSAPNTSELSVVDETPTESKFEASDDGETINLKTGETVAISKIDSISESGEVKLTVDNGAVVKASDVSFGTVAERTFIEEISNLKLGKNRISTASANALYQNAMAHLKSNPDMTLDEATTLIKGLAESYIYGAYNFGEDRLTATDENGRKIYYAGEISDSARRLAYKLGRNDSVDKTKAEQKVIDDLISNAEPKSIKKGLGKLVYEDGIQVDETSLTDTQKANIKGIELLSKITNIEFHIFRSDKAGETYMYTMLDGTVTSANGWYVAGTNEIWVDINAGNFGQGTMIRTAAHEISHYIKEWSPKQWQAMADLLMDTFAKNGVNTQRMLNKQKDKIRRRYNKENMPSEPELIDMAYEEFVCDALTDMLTDGSIVNFIAEVKQKNKSLGKKLLDAIKNLLSNWGIIIDDYKGRELETDEAQALSQFEDVFKKLQEMYQMALMDADAAYAAVGNVQAQKNTTAEGDVRLHDRSVFSEYNKPITLEDIKALRDIGRKSINDFSTDEVEVAQKWAYKFYQQLGTKSPFFRRWFGDWRAFDKGAAKIVSFAYGENGKINYSKRTIHSEELNAKILVDETIVNDSLSYAKKNGDEKQIRKLLGKIDEIISNGILLDTRISERSSGNKKGSTQFMHYLYTPISINGAPFIAKVSIEEYDLTGKNRAYNLQRIELSKVSRAQYSQLIEENREKYAYTFDALSVAQLFDFVKQNDKNFNPKPVNEALINKADGTPKVFYHGTKESFTEFVLQDNPKFGRALGDGFYFTSDYDKAFKFANGLFSKGKDRGGIIMPVYLKMENPYIIERDADRTQWKKEYNKGNYDGIIDLKNDTYYVEESNKIKSAEDGVNIGTFSEAENDIRFSERDYSYEALANKPDMKLTVVGESVPSNRADVVALAKRNAASVGKTNKDGSVSVYVDDIGAEVLLGTDGLKHGLRRVKNPQENANFIVTLKAGEILKNSIKINEILPAKENASGAYVLIGVAKSKIGNVYIVRSVVNHFNNELASIDVLYAVNAKKEELAATKSPRFAAEPLSVTSSTISISDLLDLVNKKFPDVLPEGVLKHFGYESRPEGDLGENVLFSERDSSTSNRSILASSLESAALEPDEKNLLRNYKTNIRLMEAEQKKLLEIQKQLFTKGAVDPAKREELQFEAKLITTHINSYDRELLKLEAMKPIKDVLTREKEMARKKQKQKDAELLKQYREKAAKNQRELIERHQESRKKATESRHKTAMRHQIKNVVNELNTLLTHGNKKKHIPEDLKVAVAEVLELFNMDTVSAEERVAKLKSDLMKAKTPEKIQEISRKIDNIQAMGDKFKAKLDKLKSAYDTIKSSADPEIAGGFDEVVSSRIEYVAAKVGKTPLRNMTLEQLEMVYDVYTMVLNNIREANTLFKKDNAETIQNYASRVIGEVKQAGGVREYKSLMPKVKEFFWNNLKPIFAFEKIGSKTLTSLFEDVRKGEDTWAVDITEAKDYSDSKQEKYNYKKWDFDKKYDFKTTDGKQFSLTLEQMLSLYAYSKRTQADEHLRVGGFVFDDSIEVYKENVEVKEDGEKKKKKSIIKYKVNIKSPHQISTDTLADIVGSLTNEQKAFVDEMQTYLSDVMGAKGNEVSMTLYNIRLFKEKNYFPLKSAQQFMFEQNEVAGEVKIKNSGFTESTVEHANNPIILNNFMDVWANHVNDMSMYHSFVVPLENFNRVFNYQTRRAEGMPAVSVKETLHNAYESYAVEYIRQLLTDLNGGARSDPRESTAKKLLSTFKKAKVFSSASVVIQQPSAVARALALIDEKYFDFNPKLIKHKERWEELKKYAPVAIIKEMGRFDTDMGLSTTEYIKGQKTFMQKVEDVLSKAPAYADELTWVHIWEAVKRETKAKHPDLKVGTEEFFKTAGERFTEIISKTQVYDSVLSRSANMRSKSGLMAMWTAFMAEPTTSINMIEHGLRLWKRGYKRLALKQLKGVGASIILNSALVSLVYAMRDDDEDETYLEKYLGSFVSEIVDGFNPLTYFPMVKDVWSLLQGYDVERSDMSLFSDAIDSLRGIVQTLASYDEDITDEELQKFKEDMVGSSLKLVDGVAALFGIPAGNIRRDINSIINTYKTVNNGASTSGLSLKNKLIESVKDVTPVWGWLPDEQKTDKLYDAVINGDTSYIDRLKNGYKNDKAYETALKTALGEKYKDGEIAKETASKILSEYLGESDDDIYWIFDKWDYAAENGSSDDYTKYGDFYNAVETGKSLKATINEYTSHGVSADTLAKQITTHYKPLYRQMTNYERASIKGYLLNAYALLGKNRNEKSKDINNWLKD